MKILIPMAGEGKRFSDEGYKLSKPVIPTIDRRTGKEYPMVVCATLDLPGLETDGNNLIYVDRDFHKKDGVEDKIKEFFPKATFITVDKLTEGQACTCLLAKEKIDNMLDIAKKARQEEIDVEETKNQVEEALKNITEEK